MGMLAVIGREVPRIELAHRRRAHLLPPSAHDGAAGTDRAGRERRPLLARHRPLAPDRHREHVRPLVRATRAPHARVPLGAHAAPPRRQGRRRRRDDHDPRGDRRTRAAAGAGARRRARPEDARARGHGRRRHRHLDDRPGHARPTHTVPTITAAAERAGRPAPRVVTSLPICLTADADAARERAASDFRMYGFLPSYRAMLDREGAGGPADVAIVGDEATVRKQAWRASPTRASPSSSRRSTVNVRNASATRGAAEVDAVTDDDPRSPLELLEALTVQEVEIADGFAAPRDLHDARAADAALARPRRCDRRASSRAAAGWAACSDRPTASTTTSASGSPRDGIATVRVGYRKPNDLSRCVHDVAAAADLAGRRGARRFVTMGHSFGGAVAVQAGAVLGTHCRGVVTLSTQSAGCEDARGARRHSPAALPRHRRRDPAAGDERGRADARRARRGRAAPGRRAPAVANRPRELRDRLSTWIPERSRPSERRSYVPASLATIGANSSTLSSPTTT